MVNQWEKGNAAACEEYLSVNPRQELEGPVGRSPDPKGYTLQGPWSRGSAYELRKWHNNNEKNKMEDDQDKEEPEKMTRQKRRQTLGDWILICIYIR